MRKLALSDEILLSIQQPARYIGGEVNMVQKDPKGKIRFAMCFLDAKIVDIAVRPQLQYYHKKKSFGYIFS